MPTLRPTTAPCQRPRQRSGSRSRRRFHLSRRRRCRRYEAAPARRALPVARSLPPRTAGPRCLSHIRLAACLRSCPAGARRGIIVAGLARGNAMGDSDSGYQFGTGIGDEELNRLEAQGAAIAPATRMIFAEAGIRPGMRVLDLGCGAGDVTFVAPTWWDPVAPWSASTAPRTRWPGPGCGPNDAAGAGSVRGGRHQRPGAGRAVRRDRRAAGPDVGSGPGRGAAAAGHGAATLAGVTTGWR